MNLRLLYHGHCFDGVASATTFTRFYQEKIHPGANVGYGGLLHRPGNLFDEGMFDGDENAIVDFKYSASPLLTWWFDHHQSAFLTPQDEAHFHEEASPKKFLDTTSKSCTSSSPASPVNALASMISHSKTWSIGLILSMARFTNHRRSVSS